MTANESAYAEAAAQLAPGGAAAFVDKFLDDLWNDRIREVKAALDPSFIGEHPSRRDLAFLRFEDGWGVSGRARVTDEGDELVYYVRIKGLRQEPVIIDTPTEPRESVDFIVRSSADGWKMVKIVTRLLGRQR
jgi:hypothetical protein